MHSPCIIMQNRKLHNYASSMNNYAKSLIAWKKEKHGSSPANLNRSICQRVLSGGIVLIGGLLRKVDLRNSPGGYSGCNNFVTICNMRSTFPVPSYFLKSTSSTKSSFKTKIQLPSPLYGSGKGIHATTL